MQARKPTRYTHSIELESFETMQARRELNAALGQSVEIEGSEESETFRRRKAAAIRDGATYSHTATEGDFR
jgi:hypothetical protein